MATKIAPSLRKRVLDDGAWQCYLCKCVLHEWDAHGKIVTGREATLDHLVPKSRGGRNEYRNLRACCVTCNNKKGDKPVGDFLDPEKKVRGRYNKRGRLPKSRHVQGMNGDRKRLQAEARQSRYERRREK